MPLTMAPLSSSSKGNSTFIASDTTSILVDAGIAMKRIIEELANAGRSPDEVRGILVTHEHQDHVSGIGPLSRAFDIPVYANEATWAAMEKKVGDIAKRNVRMISTTEDFYIGDLCVQPFPTSHDAVCSCGYAVTNQGARVSIVTDLGHVTTEVLDAAAGSRIVLLESNYDPQMLREGRYRESLKRRIASRRGHLSNDDAARTAEVLFHRGVRGILLGHLSEENNLYTLAEAAVSDYLTAADIVPGRDIALGVAQRAALTGVFRV